MLHIYVMIVSGKQWIISTDMYGQATIIVRAFVNHNRQFSDEQIKELINRGAVIGGALDAWMMVPGWIRGKSTPEAMNCNLEIMIDHMDHICQLAGNHCISVSAPTWMVLLGKSNARMILKQLPTCKHYRRFLKKRGYKEEDIGNVMHGNWLRFLRKAWGSENAAD